MKFSRSDFEMQRFESRRPNQPVRRKRVKYEGSLKNRAVPRDFATIRQGDHFAGGVRAMRDSFRVTWIRYDNKMLGGNERTSRHPPRMVLRTGDRHSQMAEIAIAVAVAQPRLEVAQVILCSDGLTEQGAVAVLKRAVVDDGAWSDCLGSRVPVAGPRGTSGVISDVARRFASLPAPATSIVAVSMVRIFSRVVLFNGGGRASASATPELRALDQQARSSRAGIWRGGDDGDD